jgi:CheY-like chemotaxis protein
MSMLSWLHPRTRSIGGTTGQRATRVLIVDDEEAIRRLAERVLRRGGYETAMAADGPEALRIAEEQGPFNLVLADVVMPGMPGNELGRRLRCVDPELRILYLTGYADRLFAEKAVLWENEAFLEKPVTTNGLLEAVSLMLFGHTRQGEHGPVADTACLRSLRVATQPLRVRIGDVIGQLVNISATGALVRTPEALALDSESPTLIEVEPEPVELHARVVRSHALSVSLPGAMWRRPEYAVAIAFTELPPRTKDALERLCGEAFGKLE